MQRKNNPLQVIFVIAREAMTITKGVFQTFILSYYVHISFRQRNISIFYYIRHYDQRVSKKK